MPSCSWYNVSHRMVAKLRPSPLILPTTALSTSFSVVSAPSGSTMMLAIFARNRYSTADVPVVP